MHVCMYVYIYLIYFGFIITVYESIRTDMSQCHCLSLRAIYICSFSADNQFTYEYCTRQLDYQCCDCQVLMQQKPITIIFSSFFNLQMYSGECLMCCDHFKITCVGRGSEMLFCVMQIHKSYYRREFLRVSFYWISFRTPFKFQFRQNQTLKIAT